MPTNSVAFVSNRLLVRSIHVGTGGVGKWRTVTTRMLEAQCIALAPVNKPGDAVHRGGVVGTYRDGFDTDNRGTRGTRLIGRVTNSAPHAVYVEWGRSASNKDQFFSWTRHGGIPQWYTGTRARAGRHVMKRAGEIIALRRHATWDDRTLIG